MSAIRSGVLGFGEGDPAAILAYVNFCVRCGVSNLLTRPGVATLLGMVGELKSLNRFTLPGVDLVVLLCKVWLLLLGASGMLHLTAGVPSRTTFVGVFAL